MAKYVSVEDLFECCPGLHEWADEEAVELMTHQEWNEAGRPLRRGVYVVIPTWRDDDGREFLDAGGE